MARTSKSRGTPAFQMRSSNSPHKFLGGLFGRKKGSSNATSEEKQAMVDRTMADMKRRGIGGSGSLAGGGGGFGVINMGTSQFVRDTAEAMKTGGEEGLREHLRGRVKGDRWNTDSMMTKKENNSPNKFLGKAWRKVKQGVSNVVSKIAGGGAEDLPEDTGPAVTAGKVWGGGAMVKKEGFTPYKHLLSCGNRSSMRSPLKGADPVLVRGAKDAATGYGAVKYSNIAKTQAIGNITKTVGEMIGGSASAQAWKRKRRLKKNWKADAKHRKFVERKSKGWKDKTRYS